MSDKEMGPVDPIEPANSQQDQQPVQEDAAHSENTAAEQATTVDEQPASENTEAGESIERNERGEEEPALASDLERGVAAAVLADETGIGESDNSNGSGPRRSSAATGWMIASLVLAVALIVTLFTLFSKSGGEAVATVNGEKITKDELYNMMAPASGKSVLENLITMKLVDQEASNKNVVITEEDENSELDEVKKSFPTEDQFNQALDQSGMTIDDLKVQLRMQVQLRKLLSDQVKITDDDIKSYYDEHKSSYATDEQVQASHILVATKEEADAIEEELKNGGDFAAIAKEKSTDTGSAANGGDLGYFGKGQMVPEFEQAAFSLQIGEISEPVKSDYGYHIIKVVDHKPAITPTLDEKKEEIKKAIESDQLSTLSQSLVSDLRDKATITNTLDPSANHNPADTATEAPDTENAPDTAVDPGANADNTAENN